MASRCVQVLVHGESAGRSLAWSPDGRDLATGHRHGHISFWDIATGSRSTTLERPGCRLDSLQDSHYVPCAEVVSLVWLPGGERVLAGYADGWVRLWDTISMGRLAGWFRLEHAPLVSLAYLRGPHGLVAAMADEVLFLESWGREQADSYKRAGQCPASIEPLTVMAVAPDGRMFAMAGRGKGVGLCRIPLTRDGSPFLPEIPVLAARVVALAFSPDGQRLALGLVDGVIEIWSCDGPKFELKLEGHKGKVHCLSWSPMGTLLASGSSNGGLRLWSIGEGRGIAQHEDREVGVSALAFSLCGTRLAIACEDRCTRIWQVVPEAAQNPPEPRNWPELAGITNTVIAAAVESLSLIEIAQALQGASESVQHRFLSVMPAPLAAAYHREVEALGPMPDEAVALARESVMEALRRAAP